MGQKRETKRKKGEKKRFTLFLDPSSILYVYGVQNDTVCIESREAPAVSVECVEDTVFRVIS